MDREMVDKCWKDAQVCFLPFPMPRARPNFRDGLEIVNGSPKIARQENTSNFKDIAMVRCKDKGLNLELFARAEKRFEQVKVKEAKHM